MRREGNGVDITYRIETKLGVGEEDDGAILA
jgi:hypothetical protein